jgi:hypothetical protein
LLRRINSGEYSIETVCLILTLLATNRRRV